MTIVILGIDLGKTVCSVAGLDAQGEVVLRKRLQRSRLESFLANRPACVVAMEACCGAHHVGRRAESLGHEVRLLSPAYVKPYIKAQKNDDRDAVAIAEAATRPTMPLVTLKTAEQLDLQSLHGVRDRYVRNRTQLINQIRGLLLERGITVVKTPDKLLQAMPGILADEANGLLARMRRLLEDLMVELRELEQRIAALDREIAAIAREDEAARRLMEIDGIGPLTATAIRAAAGDASAFASGRDFAAWLGLVPRQASTGGKPRLLAITKRGNSYVRRLLVHGARSALRKLETAATPMGHWLRGLLARRHRNVAVVALAQKLARIVWALLAHGRRYTAEVTPAAA